MARRRSRIPAGRSRPGSTPSTCRRPVEARARQLRGRVHGGSCSCPRWWHSAPLAPSSSRRTYRTSPGCACPGRSPTATSTPTGCLGRGRPVDSAGVISTRTGVGRGDGARRGQCLAPHTSSWDERGDSKVWLVHLVASASRSWSASSWSAASRRGSRPVTAGWPPSSSRSAQEMGALPTQARSRVEPGRSAFVAFVPGKTRRRPGAAGLAAGAALATEYQAAGVVLIVMAAWAALLGLVAAGRYLVGGVARREICARRLRLGGVWRPLASVVPLPLANELRSEQRRACSESPRPSRYPRAPRSSANSRAPVARAGPWSRPPWVSGSSGGAARRAEALVCMVASRGSFG